MEINTYQQRVTLADPVPADGYDFASIVTHETGHFLGMAHSGDPHATMFAHYQPGSTAMRNLTSDDVLGICTVYRPDGDRTLSGESTVPQDACDPTPRHGFTTQCAPQVAKGCTGKSSVTPSSAPGGLLFALGLVVAALRRATSAGRSARPCSRRGSGT
jgi:hypothetical protein